MRLNIVTMLMVNENIWLCYFSLFPYFTLACVSSISCVFISLECFNFGGIIDWNVYTPTLENNERGKIILRLYKSFFYIFILFPQSIVTKTKRDFCRPFGCSPNWRQTSLPSKIILYDISVSASQYIAITLTCSYKFVLTHWSGRNTSTMVMMGIVIYVEKKMCC